tara:strand:+ start:386 stop:835 length:450 start_codon:yes stop_codon:yes gene_type:complete
MSKILYTNAEGTLCVVTPINENKTIEEIAAKVVPDGISYEIIEDSAVPTDRSFRDAWKQNSKTIETDMTKAREVHKQKIRFARELLFADLDVEFQKALETDDASKKTEVINKKQALRDAPADSGIAAASNETELKAQWNKTLLGDSPYS